MEKDDRELLIEYAKSHLCDLIPYDDPNYEEKLQRMAESYVDSEMNTNVDVDAIIEQAENIRKAEQDKQVIWWSNDDEILNFKITIL